MSLDARPKDEYQAPALIVLGSLEELTQGADNFGSDFPRGSGGTS
jgi:hypothetical protein